MDQIIKEMRDQMIQTLAKWVRIPSVKGEPQPGAPFGVQVREALDAALADAQAMGFAVRNFDGYVGDVRMGPEGVNPLAILGHLDVVPQGEGWDTDPFGAEIRDGRMYGRGTEDDKGPVVAALYAMLALKKTGIPLKREVRLILGCDEESGMECVKHYAKVCDLPRVGFSPDGVFPVINTEKGMLHLSLHGDWCQDGLQVLEFCVGERPNVVPGKAKALVSGEEDLVEKANAAARELGLEVTAKIAEAGVVELYSEGIPGHAAYPEVTRNAVGQLLLVLKALGVEGPLKAVAEKIGMEYYGESLEMACQDGVSGPLTCNLGIIRYTREEGLYATLDIRYPILANPTALAAAATAALAPAVRVVVDSQKEPHHVAPNSKLIQSLLSAYTEVSGRPGECLSTGGGTYARLLQEGVAFGSVFPGEEEVCHHANEYFDLNSLELNVKIFARAIELLQDC